jgi:hypothetical protein
MPDNANPYVPGLPTDNPALFFGRRELLVSIGEHLVKGRRVLLVASPPRMGKTSLLRQLPRHLPPDLLAVRFELREEDATGLDRLLWHLAGALAAQLGPQLGLHLPAPDWSAFEGRTGQLGDFWASLRGVLGERGLVLLLDDLHCLADREAGFLDGFMDVLAGWRDGDEGVAFVLTSNLAAQEQLVRDHPQLLAGSVSYTLGPLNGEEATRLITWPVDGVLTYDYGVARRIIEISSGQPYYLHLFCFEVYRRCAPAGWVNLHDVDLVVADLVSREIADFRQVWDESTPAEQAVLAALVSLRGVRGVATIQEVRTVLVKAGSRPERGQVAAILERLTLRGILERLGALTYRFRVALLRDWLAERVELRQVARGTRWNSEPGPPPSVRQVSMLAPSHSRRPAPAAKAEQPEDEAKAAPAAKVRRHRWTWLAPAAVAGVALVALLGSGILSGGLGGTPPPPSGVTATALPAIATQAAASTTAGATSLPALPPTATAEPLPTGTATPTPPVVLAHSVPAIAYQSRVQGESAWSLFVMDSNGGNRRLVTAGQAGYLSPPAWSPDGSRLVLISDRTGSTDLWMVDLDGSNARNLTQDEAKDHSPAWSPDGQWIVFASLRDSLYWELYLMRVEGGDVQRLTWWEDASDLSPSWSPDGRRIAFASKRDGNWEIYAMDRDGGNLLRLTDHPADDSNPAWSPDGGRIAFESTREGYAEIFVVSVAGGEAVNISNAPLSSEHGPTWSPDGSRIAFYSDRDGEWDIYTMASDGSDVVKLTGENSNDQVPAWRP